MTDLAPTHVEETILGVLEGLSPDRRIEVLEFALFIKMRQARQSSGERAESEQPLEHNSRYPLHGTVLRYDEPFAPVAQTHWETLQ
jgi:hypothetical protein